MAKRKLDAHHPKHDPVHSAHDWGTRTYACAVLDEEKRVFDLAIFVMLPRPWEGNDRMSIRGPRWLLEWLRMPIP